MINRPKYKTARRLGPNVFEKTQGQKFSIRESQRKGEKKMRPKSDYGLQMLEKQKAKVTYGVSERMFAKHVKGVLASGTADLSGALTAILESRLDNVVYRLGIAPTRQAARQMVSHGHFMVNGSRVDIPSYQVSLGDKVSVRQGSAGKAIFANLAEKIKDRTIPAWLKFDLPKLEAKVEGAPKLTSLETNFDLAAVLNFYSR